MSNIKKLDIVEIAKDEMVGKANYSEKQLRVIQSKLLPADITAEEIALVLNISKTTGASILAKELIVTKEKGNFTPIFSKAFLVKKAYENPLFSSYTSAPVYEKDDFAINWGEGTIKHISNPLKERGMLKGAWCIGAFTDGTKTMFFAELGTYNKKVNVWLENPVAMIVKTAEATVLRRFIKGGETMYTDAEIEYEAPKKVKKPTGKQLKNLLK